MPTKEECDAEYTKARTSLDGRASPFVPGVGLRLSQEFQPMYFSGEVKVHADMKHKGAQKRHNSVVKRVETFFFFHMD